MDRLCERIHLHRKLLDLVIVDDDPTYLTVLGKLLAKSGFEQIRLFSDPKQADNFLLNSRPDVLISDYQMPEMTGLDLINKYDNIRNRIIISGSPKPSDCKLVNWFQKPVPFSILLKILDSQLANVIEKANKVALESLQVSRRLIFRPRRAQSPDIPVNFPRSFR